MAKPRTAAQIWNDLKIAWRGYKIAKASLNKDKMKEYGEKVISCQQELGVKSVTRKDLRI